MVKMINPYAVIIGPRITEKSMALSYGPSRHTQEDAQRKYTFLVDVKANKIQIKQAFELIYNQDKSKGSDKIEVDKVHVIKMQGKMRRNFKKHGRKSDFKKAIITLKKGQLLEDYGV
jgi:large subunit ribosomal protein L23